MRNLLFVFPDLEYGGATCQLTRLAVGRPAEECRVRVCVLSSGGPLRALLEQAGIEVACLGWERAFDPAPLQRWRQVLGRWRPDVIHAAKLSPLRLAVLLRSGYPSRLIVSHLLPTHCGLTQLALTDRWLASRAEHLVASGLTEADWLRSQGLPASRLAVIPPGVEVVPTASLSRGEVCRRLRLPEDARLLVCVGPLERHKGFSDVIWSFDMLRDLFEDLRLVVVGDGPDRRRLEQFTRGIRLHDRVLFVGAQADVANLLACAEVVLAPSVRPGGRMAILEAMALGVPVVTTRLPFLEEIVRDGETGLVVPPGEKQTLARKTRALLEDPERRRTFGEAGRQRVRDQFSAAGMRRYYADLYLGKPLS